MYVTYPMLKNHVSLLLWLELGLEYLRTRALGSALSSAESNKSSTY